ncbi:MAG: amidase, partial [Bacteroidota bacterium]
MPLSPNLPRLTGTALRLFTSAVEGPARKLLVRKFERELGLDRFRATQVMEPPTLHPVWPVERRAEQGARVWDHELPRRSFESADEGFQYTSVLDYGRAYWEGRTTPLEVAERIIAAFETVQDAIAPFITFDADQLLRDAEASSMRLAGGLGRGPFEGVPVAVKDEFDVAGLPTKVGTAFRNHVAEFDAAAVARMRAGGALLIGKTVMHEYGMGVTGVNVRGGTARNPYAPGHMTGGSSSGSGAIVASGLCPVALGADAGGSIRIPAALCGQFGLKPTFGRISSFGEAPLAWSTACAGPIASTATDLALAYAQLAGPDPNDPLTLEQPRPSLLEWGSADLGNVRIGIPTALFESADPEIARTCEQMLGVFGEHEAQLVPIELPAI